MQRLHSSYPNGLPGVALILLRISVAGLPFACQTDRAVLLKLPLLIGLTLAVAAALCLGVLTTQSATVALSVQTVLLYFSHPRHLILSLLFSALCLATAMLGAGYYSVDGSLYGRRRMALPVRAGTNVKAALE
jgi:uncharacterized membrane protein YphA (DoxX/SURF4 family)